MDSLLRPPDYLGLMLTSKCPSQCGHCLYICGPKRSEDEDMDIKQVESCLSDLKRLGLTQTSLHLGGGEPFLVFPVLVEAIPLVLKTRFYLDFVETGGGWFTSRIEAAERLMALKAAGMERLLISMSPFHQTFIAPSKVRALIKTATMLLGPDSLILNTLPLLEDVERISPQDAIPFDDYMKAVGPDHGIAVLWNNFMPLQLGGRAPETLKHWLPRLDVSSFKEDCQAWLLQTGNWHYGLNKRVHTGYCAGLTFPAPEGFYAWYKSFRLEDWPIAWMIAKEGLAALIEFARSEAGFKIDPEGYVSACHVCQDARLSLWRLGYFKELGPDDFYRELQALKEAARNRHGNES